LILEFSDNYKLVYKPRKLQIVNEFHSLIEWINQKKALLPLPTFNSLTLKDYHYEEFVENKSAETPLNVEEYYIRFGYYVGLFYVLCGNDFHLENIIASKDSPVPIDLETIFQCNVPLNMPDMAGIEAKYDLTVNSVVGTSLLPVIGFNDNKEQKGIDISALNGKESKLPFKVLVAKDVNTENFRYEYDFVTRPGANNLLKYNGMIIDYKSYRKNIIDGFNDMLNFIILRKDDFIRRIGKFKDVQVRNVIKATAKYMQLLDFSTHPSYLSDMIEREHLLENNWAYPYINKEVILYEVEDMMFDDVPIFYSRINEPHIYTYKGDKISNFFKQSAYAKVTGRINSLSTETIEKQISIMKVALKLYDTELERLSGQQKLSALTGNEEIDFSVLNKKVKSIANTIINKAYETNTNKITWGNINQVHEGWEIEPLEVGLYRGASGMGLLFLELYNFTQDESYLSVYHKIMNNVYVEAKNSGVLSAYSGGLSVIFTMLREKQILNTINKDYLDSCINFIRDNLHNSSNVDWLMGLSGILSLLTELYKVYPSEDNFTLGEKVYDYLLNADYEPAVGLGHGNTGIALAIIKAQRVFNFNSDYTDEIIEGLLFAENKLLLKNNVKLSWCNGTTGVGIGRLAMLNHVQSSKWNELILEPLEKSYFKVKGIHKNDDCICHGNTGDIHYLTLLKESNHPSFDKALYIKKINLLINSQKWSLRGLPGIPELNLFLGTAGIAFELLRLISTEGISNPLTLELP
ncbi:type 2 lantipeptide synthetase LanM, partial [Bacillus sp. BH2]|uniref:type 2 lanthipeptide synthetase LanM n=1 Tax=Bacillus sp. BH2 TaxID=2528958 RepID=UPI0010649C11